MKTFSGIKAVSMIQIVELTGERPGPCEGSGSSQVLTTWRTPPGWDHSSSLHL